MNEQLQTAYAGQAGSGPLVEQRNRVLRNTYWLLALSLVPTVLGAWIGVKTGIMASMGMGLSLIVFLVGAFGLMFAIEPQTLTGGGGSTVAATAGPFDAASRRASVGDRTPARRAKLAATPGGKLEKSGIGIGGGMRCGPELPFSANGIGSGGGGPAALRLPWPLAPLKCTPLAAGCIGGRSAVNGT